MSEVLLKSDGYEHTKFSAIYDGFSGFKRLQVEGFQGERPAEFERLHGATYGLEDMQDIHEFIGGLIADAIAQRKGKA